MSANSTDYSFLSLTVFGLLSSSLLLFPQHFGWYVLRSSSGVCRTRETSRNFELILYWIHGDRLFWFRLWLTESEQATPVDSIKDALRSSVKVPEFDKHLKKIGGHISRNVVEITIKMKTIVQKPLMIKNHQASSQKFRQQIIHCWMKDRKEILTSVQRKNRLCLENELNIILSANMTVS